MKTPTLRETQLLFQSWRNQKKYKQEPIPDNLWETAAILTKHHSRSKVCQALKLSSTDLKKHVLKLQTAPQRALPVPTGVKPWSITCNRADGAELKLSGIDPLPDINTVLAAFLMPVENKSFQTL